MQIFFQKHKKLLSVSITVITSVFLVVLVVSAATTIGASIVTGGSVTVGDVVTSDANNVDNLGSYAASWKDVYVSGTIFASNILAGGLNIGTGDATSTIKGGASVTSTISSGMIIEEASATSTLQIGGALISGEGGCIVLNSGADSGGTLYLFPLIGDGGIYLATSTSAADCY